MKLPLYPVSLALVLVCLVCSVDAQKRKRTSRESVRMAIAIDETLSVLRVRPSLFATPIQRMRRGRRIQILGATEADGVKFFKVSVPPGSSGWIQSDALLWRHQADEQRLARLIQTAEGFEQVELASIFLDMYPSSNLRPSVLLLFGDLLEEAAVKLSRDAGSRLSRRSMVASGAPEYSYYLNFNMLDRYRRLGATFLFNASTKKFHYDGHSWREIVQKFRAAPERPEAQKRLDVLREKLERKAGANN